MFFALLALVRLYTAWTGQLTRPVLAAGVVAEMAVLLFCIWAAGKIFRTGLLMQGKAPSFRELARWVMAK